jgi:hypothetical protein
VNADAHLCECGCGQTVDTWTHTDVSMGRIKGQPKRFVRGHNLPGGRGRDEADRFWDKVDRRAASECWLWTSGKDIHGYGKFMRTDRSDVGAHRFVYELMRGPIPDGLVLDHLCRTRHCVNPAHLEAVTSRENTLRGVGLTAVNATKTHCKHGHEFTEENTYYRKGRNARTCRECARTALRKSRAAKAVA